MLCILNLWYWSQLFLKLFNWFLFMVHKFSSELCYIIKHCLKFHTVGNIDIFFLNFEPAIFTYFKSLNSWKCCEDKLWPCIEQNPHYSNDAVVWKFHVISSFLLKIVANADCTFFNKEYFINFFKFIMNYSFCQFKSRSQRR